MTRLEEKHLLGIRWFHRVSFPLLFLMIWSGLLVYWANDVYRVGLARTKIPGAFCKPPLDLEMPL
jgi:hypothetical protein